MLDRYKPKKFKFKKLHKGRVKPINYRKSATNLRYGVWGLKVLKSTRLTASQIEAARRVISRAIRKKEKLWIRCSTDIPVTKKPKDMRMGSGKGPVEFWMHRITAGKILFELGAIKAIKARRVLISASKKLPIPVEIIKKSVTKWDTKSSFVFFKA